MLDEEEVVIRKTHVWSVLAVFVLSEEDIGQWSKDGVVELGTLQGVAGPICSACEKSPEEAEESCPG